MLVMPLAAWLTTRNRHGDDATALPVLAAIAVLGLLVLATYAWRNRLLRQSAVDIG